MFILLLLLLLPSKSFYVFFPLAWLCLTIYLRGKIILGKEVCLSVLVIGMLIVFSLIRMLYFQTSLYPDLKEISKFLSIPLFLMLGNNMKERFYKDFFYASLLFSIINLGVVFLQYTQLSSGISEYLFSIFNLEGTRDLVFPKSIIHLRAIGLSPGPGEQGTLNGVLLLYFLFMKLYKKEKYSFLGIFCTVLQVLLCQSRTALVGLGVSLFFILLINSFKEKRIIRNISIKLLFIAALLIFLFLHLFSSYFLYFNLLFEQGTNLSSFEGRKDIWIFLLSVIENNWMLLPIGYGRSAFPEQSVFDNEYIYFFVIQGVIISVIFYFSVFYFILKTMINWRSVIWVKKYICSILIMGLVSGFGLLFFTEPKISIVVLLFINYSLILKKQCKISPSFAY